MYPLWMVALCAVAGAVGRPQGGGSPLPPMEHLGPVDSLQPMEPVHVQPRDINVINEPTCEELMAMWRFSKRQARTPEIMNEIPTYKDPLSFNVWTPYYGSTSAEYVSTSRSAGGGTRFRTGPSRRPPLIYGRVVHRAPISGPVGFQTHGGKGYDQVAKLYGAIQGDGAVRRPNILRLPGGGIPAQTGKFQDLKELIKTERARELQQQRAAEEMAARAAALKEIAGGQRYREEYHGHKHREYLRAPWGARQEDYNMADDPSYYHTPRYSGETGHQHGNPDGMITYPDLFAPPTRRSSTLFSHRSQPDYILTPLFADDDEIYLNPFAYGAHAGLVRNLINAHSMQRPDNSHGMSFN